MGKRKYMFWAMTFWIAISLSFIMACLHRKLKLSNKEGISEVNRHRMCFFSIN